MMFFVLFAPSDIYYYKLLGFKEKINRSLDIFYVSTHMWEGMLPDDLDVGAYTVKVRTTDMLGQKWEAHRIFYITE